MAFKAEYTDRPLTEEEKIFAEEHHDMIYRYLRIHDLPIDPWYDILIIPYLQAVKKYHTYERLQKLKFDQIFFRTLDSARSCYYRDLNRKKRCPEGGLCSLSYVLDDMPEDKNLEGRGVWWIDKTKDVERYVIEKEFLNDVYNHTEHYADADLLKLILVMVNEGYTVIEIAEQARKDFSSEFDGCTQKDVERVIKKLYRKRSDCIVRLLIAEIMEQYQ